MIKSKKIRQQIKLVFLLFVPIAMVSFTKWYLTERVPLKENLPKLAIVKDEPIPTFSFINQYNKKVTNQTYDDMIYVVDFMFTTCPTICKQMTFKMAYLERELKKYDNVKFLSHTINPEYDTPEVLLEYANKYASDLGVDLSRWNFVTGNRDSIYNIAKSYLLVAEKGINSDHGGFIHSGDFVLIDNKGRIRSGYDTKGNPIGAYDGTSAQSVKDLIVDVGVLVKEIKREKKSSKKS